MQAARSIRRAFPWLWTVAVAVTAGSVLSLRFARSLAWEGRSVIAPSTLDGNEAFYRDLSLAGLGLGVGLLLLAVWHTVQDRDFRRRRRRPKAPAPRATSEAGSGTGA